MAMREYRDGSGAAWRVYEVRPVSAIIRRVTAPDAVAGDASDTPATYTSDRRAWLVFEHGDETRRLSPVPQAWEQLSDAELEALCSRAVPARSRRPL